MRFCLYSLVMLLSFSLSAQQFGGFPPSVHWKQINSDTSRIIFQQPAYKQAERVAAIINRIARENPNPLGNKVQKINTVLQSTTTIANGYVALAPFRSEYYLIPSSDIFATGANQWQEQLAVHEYRHVHQYSNFNRGISKAASFILGEEGQALFNSLAIPDWFFEGDAVHAETVLTRSGRGRTPFFFNGYNALFRERKNYSWMKLRNGSLKEYVPDHYQLGYLLTNYGYLKYGSDFWRKITQDAAAFKSIIYPFQGAIKRHAGVEYKSFRNEAISYYQQQVSQKRTDTIMKGVTNYFFPQYISADSLVYLKSSYHEIPAFYTVSNNIEKKIKLRNISNEEWFSYRNGNILYTAYDVNPRWRLKDYSNIIQYNMQTGEERKLTQLGKYFNPDLSPSEKNIITVSVNDSATSELHLLDNYGSVVKKWNATDEEFFLHPKFIDDENIVYAVRLKNAKMALNVLNLASGKTDTLIKAGYALIGYPFPSGDYIYFTSSLAGNDDLYMVHTKTKAINQLLTGISGNYYPAVFNDQIAWSKFSTHGLQLQSGSVTALQKKAITVNEWQQVQLPFPIAGIDTSPNVLQTSKQSIEIDAYKQGKHLINFHSWRPYFTDPEFTFSLFSNNILSTFSNELYYRYNLNETSHAVGITSNYGALFPVLSAGVTYTMNRTITTPRRTLVLNQFEAFTGYTIPLNFTAGKTYKFLNFGSNAVHNRITPTGFYKDSIPNITNNYLHHFLNWTQQLPRALQHIFPRFGYGVSLAHRHLLGDDGYQFIGTSRFFLPSVKNHSIVLTSALQQADTANVVFSNRFTNSRGYGNQFYLNENRRWRISGNYHMPLLYLDWGFANIVYFLRLRSNVFYDFTKINTKDLRGARELRSIGTEIFFDSKWWNQLPVTFGFRISHLLNDDFNRRAGANVFEFIIPVDLIPR